jgi:hypothetical protein
MFAKLTTKIALRKAGVPSSFSVPTFSTATDNSNPQTHKKASSEDNILLPFTNPFKDVTIPAVWNTWATPPPPPVEVRCERPSVGSNVLQLGSETRGKLGLGDGRECLVVFLRWCGCPCTFFLPLDFLFSMFFHLLSIVFKIPELRETDFEM